MWREVDAGAAHDADEVEFIGAVADGVHLGDALVDGAGVSGEPASGEPGVQLDVLVADELGVLHGPVGGGECLGAGAVQGAPAGHAHEDVGVHGGRWQTADQVLGRGQFLPAVTAGEGLHQVGALDPEPGGAQRVRLAVQDPHGLLGDGEGSFTVAAEAGGDGGFGHQVEVAQRGGVRFAAARRVDLGVVDGAQGAAHLVGDVVPQLHGPFQQPQLLGEGVAAAGLDGGLQHGGEGLGRIVCAVPVAGEAGGALTRADEGGVGFQRLGVAAVEPGAFAGQQIVADGLADQRVPEAVAVALRCGEQEVGADGSAQRLDEIVLGEAGDRGQQSVLDGGTALGDDPGDLLGVFGERFDTDEKEVAQRVGESGAVAALQVAGELFDEEGVAVGPFEYLVDEVGFGGGREDARELATDLGAVEAGEFDPADGAEPVQFGEQGAQGVAAVDVIGPVGADHDEAAAAQRAEEIGEQVPGGGVGPVQVLQDEDDGPVGGDAFQQPRGELEEAGGSVLVGGVPVGFAEFGSSLASSPSCPAQAAAISSGRVRRRARNAVENGAYGSPSAPISTQPPTATTASRRPAAVRNSSTSRVLPTPASPPMSSACGSPPGAPGRPGSPAVARASASVSEVSSPARPTNTGLTDLVSTPPSIAHGSDTVAVGGKSALIARSSRGADEPIPERTHHPFVLLAP